MFMIRQASEHVWQLCSDDEVVASFSDAGPVRGYDAAVAYLGQLLDAAKPRAELAVEDGLLPERWASPEGGGIAFSEKLPGGRDFTSTVWSWRDPQANLVPLMANEGSSGHFDARLAGFVETFGLDGGTVTASGRLFDNDAGRELRDRIAAAGHMPVSVDPSEAVDVTENFTVTDYDDEGFPIDGEYSAVFHSYEIAGLTALPFQGFNDAQIVLTSEAPMAAPVAASAAPTLPPRAWFFEPEPDAADDRMVEQAPGVFACPLTITDAGQVYGHLTYWGQCHVADPWGPGICASAEPSPSGYAEFMTGTRQTAEGELVPTGVLTVGCEHSSAFDCAGVRDALAHSGMGWADVRIIDGTHGPWLAGALKPSLTDEQVALLRALSLSGEWVGDLGGILAVNRPGLPIVRALAASAGVTVPTGRLAASYAGGKRTKLVGGNIVRRCPECEKRDRLTFTTASNTGNFTLGNYRQRFWPEQVALDSSPTLHEVLDTVRRIDRRTRHLNEAAAERLRASVQSE
jgi:hypothetical protein